MSRDVTGEPSGFRLLAEALPHLVWFARSDGAVTFYNRRIELYGGDIAPGPDGLYEWAPIVHPDDLDRTQRAWQQAVRLQQQYECEHRVRMADGSFRWHLSRALPLQTGTDVTWFGTATDTHVLEETREALTESESRLRSVFSAIDQGYCVCELVLDDEGVAVDYRFLETNPLFEHATGLRDPVGRTALELVPSLEPYWVQTYAEVALGDTPRRFQQASPAMGRHFDVFATPVAPRGRFVLVFTDITERQAALEALAESERRFRNMADHAPVMIWLTDADGACTYLNRPWYDFTGQTEQEALGSRWLDAAHPDDRARAAEVFADANRRRAPFSLDYRLRRHDGEYRWAVDAAAPRFSDDGRFLGYVGSVLDITERKAAEQALRAQRDRDHEIAVSLQRSMLPTALVEHDRIEIAAVYVASEELQHVGGDWYETFHLADGRIGVVVGDVVGHNIEAAAAMGQLRAAILALATHVDRPDQLLDETDEFAQRYRITDFATAVCLAVDPLEGRIEYSAAGHPPALICPPGGAPRWLDDARSLPLGVREPNGRPFAADTLDAGSVLVAYSDGLIERSGELIDVGMERLARVVARNSEADLESLCATVLSELAGDHGFDDDTVLVALRLAPR